MDKKIFAANWKLAGSIESTYNWLEAFQKDDIKKYLQPPNTVIVYPPLQLLSLIYDYVKKNNINIMVGAQDLNVHAESLYTAEGGKKHTAQTYVPGLIKDTADCVVLGHSETRKDMGVTADDVNGKINLAKKYGLNMTVCVADIDQVRSIKEADEGYNQIISYEPVAHIGTGVAANPEDADKMAANILEIFPQATISYGGSVNPDNIKSFITKSHISGVLIGDKSSDPDFFFNIIKNGSTAR